MRSKPFVIWTLQRTGGTNLARRLFERSGLLEAARAAVAEGAPGAGWLEGVESQWMLHEPFSSGEPVRVFASVTERWYKDHDRKALDGAMTEICALRLPMKHCVEMVSWEISEALATAACDAGYAHLFLYRRKPLNRLLSLHYAKMTGVWGPHFRNKGELSDRIFSEPLPVDELVEHEKLCASRLDQAWRLLQPRGALAVAYEDVYQSRDQQAAARVLAPVLAHLGIASEKADDRKLITELVTWGDQCTREKYGAFSGIDALETKLRELRPFSPGSAELEIIPSWQSAGNVLHAKIDVFPERVEWGRNLDIGGVLVLKEPLAPGFKLFLVNGDARQPVKWGISSPGMAKRFPHSSNGAHARFKISGAQQEAGSVLEIRLDDGQGNERTMFVLKIGVEV